MTHWWNQGEKYTIAISNLILVKSKSATKNSIIIMINPRCLVSINRWESWSKLCKAVPYVIHLMLPAYLQINFVNSSNNYSVQ